MPKCPHCAASIERPAFRGESLVYYVCGRCGVATTERPPLPKIAEGPQRESHDLGNEGKDLRRSVNTTETKNTRRNGRRRSK
jgi:hypothetical protein